MAKIDTDVIGGNYNVGKDSHVDNFELVSINAHIRKHPIEVVGARLREAMTAMKKVI